jgi:lysophospholipase L1-like esterase
MKAGVGKLSALVVLVMTMANTELLAREMIVVTLGTSLTARGGWQAPLRDALEKCLSRPVKIELVAKSGSTTDWALTQVDRVVSLQPDIVLVEFYVNDAALNRFMTVSRSRNNIERIITSLRERLPDARIVSMIMSPVIGPRGWIRPFLSSYIAAHRAVSDAHGIETIDFSPLWNAMARRELEAAIPDGGHPRPDVAAKIMVPELVRTLAPTCKP